MYCGGRHEESTATTLQDFLVSLYLVLALGLVSTRGLVRWAAPKLAAAGSPLVSGRVVALEEVAAGDVEFAQGVFCPPDGEVGSSGNIGMDAGCSVRGWAGEWFGVPAALGCTGSCHHAGRLLPARQ